MPFNRGFVLIYDIHRNGDLQQIMADMDIAQSFSEREVRTVIAQLIVGLKGLHRAGFVHRDIKPSNIMIDSNGHVTIIDLGLAIRASDMTNYEHAGTPAYFSPEVVEKTAIMDGCQSSQDWWALGAIFFELIELIALSHCSGDSESDLFQRIRGGHIPSLDDKPADRVLKGLLNRNELN